MQLKALLAALIVAVAPVAASAVTVPVSAGDMDSLSETLSPGDSITYSFTSTSPVKISFSTSGSGMLDDLSKITYNGVGYADINPGMPASATGDLASVILPPSPFDVTVELSGAAAANVGTTLSYSVTNIPLPAAGWMLLGGLAGLGVLGRRRA